MARSLPELSRPGPISVGKRRPPGQRRRHGIGQDVAGRASTSTLLSPFDMNTITTWNPFRDMEAMQDRILRAMNLSTSRRGEDARQSLTTSDWAPTVDISEDANEYLI